MLFSGNVKSLLAPLLVSLACNAANAETEARQLGDVQAVGIKTGIDMDSKTQALSGIKTAPAQPMEHHAEFMALGKVISIQPLLALRERYLVTQAELDGAKARQKQSGQSLKRQQELFRHGIAAKRALQEQEALGLGDQALVDASQVKLMAIANEARLSWGKALAEWALARQTDKLAALLSGQHQIVQVTLPTNKQLPSRVDSIFIEPSGLRAKAYKATLISRTAQADNAQQGESYFFQVSGAGLRAGMKLSAWLPEEGMRQSGVIVPESALVWYMDQVYVYIKSGKGSFSRRPIKNFIPSPEGYFLPDDIGAGEEIVITGAQTLLSEELRGQIPDEDDP